MELRNTISTWLSEGKLMQLSTSVNDQPWICTVGFVSDKDLNIYWFSKTSRRHSIEVMQNNKVAAAIVHDTRTRQALQLTGTASPLPTEEVERVHALYASKLGFAPASVDIFKEADDISFWHLKPGVISVWDEGNSPAEPKQEYILKS